MSEKLHKKSKKALYIVASLVLSLVSLGSSLFGGPAPKGGEVYADVAPSPSTDPACPAPDCCSPA